MRWLALASMLVAVPASAERITWADWVGTYSGPLRWAKQCASPGARKAAVSLDAVDGELVVDLSAAKGGLSTVTLTADDDGTLAGADLDAHVHVVRPSDGRLGITITYASGCAVTAALKRRGGTGTCATLDRWKAIAARCTRGEPAPPRPVPRTAAACLSQAQRLERSLVHRGCAPDPAATPRGPRCTTLATIAARYTRCATATPALQARAEMALTLPTTADDPTTRARVEEVCASEADRLRALAHGTGCQ